MTKSETLLAEVEAKAAQVTALFDEADEKGGDDSAIRDQVVGLNKEIEELEKRASDAKGMEAIRERNEERVDSARKPVTRMEHSGSQNGKAADRREAVKSVGEQFTDSADWQAYFKAIAPAGQVGEKTHVQSPAFILPVSIKTLITGVSDTGAGAFIIADQSGIYDGLGRRPLTIRDLISVRTTSSDLIEFVRQTSRVNAAATVAEATAAAGSSGVKPEGGMAFERVQATVKTIAEWVPATKRSLSDAGQIRGIINDELRADLEEELEDQLLNGDGVGENFTGLDAVSGTQDQAWSVDALTTLRKARTLVRTVGRAIPTAFVMSPDDWQTIDLLKDNESRYYFGGPSVLGTPRVWGLPVVESEAQATGNAWVGDWRRMVLWDREQAMFSVSDSHADFFIRNLVAILAELRAAMGVIRPSAFVEVDLTA